MLNHEVTRKNKSVCLCLKYSPYLHGGDDHASVHDELAQSCRALVAVPAVNHEQATDVFKLSDGEVCSQRRLLPFLFTHTQYKDAALPRGCKALPFKYQLPLKKRYKPQN